MFPEFFRKKLRKNSGKFPTFYFSGKVTTLITGDHRCDRPDHHHALQQRPAADPRPTHFMNPEAVADRKSPPRQPIPQTPYILPHSEVVKIPFKISRILIAIRINTKI